MKISRVLTLCIIGLCAVSCSKDPQDEPQGPPEPDPEIVNPAQPGTTELTVTLPNDINCENLQVAGNSFNIQISSSDKWSAEKTGTWISISPDKGSKGKHDLKVVFEANPTGDTRTASIKFTSESKSLTFDFRQEARSLSIAQNSFQVPSAGGTVNVTVSTNMPDDTKVDVSTDFIRFIQRSGETYTFQLPKNPDQQSRSAMIKISNGDLVQWITVEQDGQDLFEDNTTIPDIPTEPVNPF